ncbi:MAG TPA: nuclear transport factor 2 family protein [Pyrinomonadaceae bacterium]
MSEKENIEVVQKAYQSFKSGNIPALLNLLSDDVTWQLPEMENVPFGGLREGREQVAEFFATLGGSQESLSFEPREFVAQNDKVVGLGRYTWRARANGREYGGDWAHVFTVRDGRITGFQEYTDTAAAVAAHQKAAAA